jgi:hypothetical protein
VWTFTPEPLWVLKNEWRTGHHVRQY